MEKPEILTDLPLLETRSKASILSNVHSYRKPIINGLLRAGEIMNVIAAPKSGKSWLVLYLANCVASGSEFLGMRTSVNRVMIFDNELHEETLGMRLRTAEKAFPGGCSDFDVLIRRGQNNSIFHVADLLIETLKQRKIEVLIIDALYKMFPTDQPFSENSNSDMTMIYNELDRIATASNCAIIIVHHASKGSQTGKSVTDGGSGAGAISRAADTHLFLRPHAEEGLIVFEAVVRSWPPFSPFVAERDTETGAWERKDDYDPGDIEGQVDRPAQADEDDIAGVLTSLPCDLETIQAKIEATGRKIGIKRLRGVLGMMCEKGGACVIIAERGKKTYAVPAEKTITDQAKEMSANGKSANEIADQLGVGVSTVHQILSH